MWSKLYVQMALECEFMAKTWLYLLLRLSRASFKEFGYVGLGPYTLGTIGCHKNRSGSLAKEETLPWTHQCNKLHFIICAVLLSEFVSRGVWLQQRHLGSPIKEAALENFLQSKSWPNCTVELCKTSVRLSPVQSLSRLWLFATPWIAARQASLSLTNSWSLPKFMSIESVMPFSHLILCHPLLLPHPIPPSIRVFSNESTLRIKWPNYWSFSFSISPSNEHPELISFRMDWLDFLVVQGTQEFSSTPQFKSINSSVLSFLLNTEFA